MKSRRKCGFFEEEKMGGDYLLYIELPYNH